MATQLWNKEITKSVDWGGDTSTGGAPVSGQFVQKFIKDTLAKKFGYLNYDRDNLKYQVFADEEDFQTWREDPLVNANLLLATFDAPAPASIIAKAVSSMNVTILSSEKNNQIKFNYHIIDSGSNPMAERINMRMTVINGGLSQTYTTTYEPDYDHFSDTEEDGKTYVGTTKTIDIDDYLNVGTNSVTITLTGASTQAQTTMTFKFTVVELNIESNFDNSVAQVYDSLKDVDILFDTQLGNVINIPFTCSGQGTKFIEIYVNGEEFKQTSIKDAISSGDIISSNEEFRSSLFLFMSEKNGSLRAPFKDGKNSLQFRIYILDADRNKIYSRTLYYDIIIRNATNSEDVVYILYKQSFNNKDYVFRPEDRIEFSTRQYSSSSFEYSVYSSTGKQVPLLFTLVDTDTNTKIAEQERTLNSGVVDTFNYSFMTYGNIEITISTQLKDGSGRPLDNVSDTMKVYVNVERADVQIEVLKGQDLLLNLEALNRSNSEPEEKRNKWIDEDHKNIVPVFKNVYFNDASGWDGEALLLNNGATVEIPYNIFGTNKTALDANGLTFEVTFEMINVQDEEAVMLSFKDEANNSSIELTASQAKMVDQGGIDVYTKFNSNTKIKMAFVINPADDKWKGDATGRSSAYANFIIVNGILDKANEYSGNMIWNNASNPKIVVGNADGKAGIRLFSLRVYNKALSLDEELTNWIAESGDILRNYDKNDIYEAGSQNPSLQILRTKIPTLIIYGNVDYLNDAGKTAKKKDNYEMDLLFHDPEDTDRDFYARGCWVSPQGTSSLAYPVRNLRPYFSKTSDDLSKDDGKYWTEVYLAGEFDENDLSEDKLGHFYTNKKTTPYKHKINGESVTEYYHKCYNYDQAKKLEKNGDQIFYKSGDDYIPCSLNVGAGKGPIDCPVKSDGTPANDLYVYGAREVKAFKAGGISKDDSTYADRYWKLLKEIRLSGQTLFTVDKTIEIENPISGVVYPVKIFKKVKGSNEISAKKTYYLIQGIWKQYEKSGWTDRWTLKADYAESSMCNNAGTGRLWGDAMKGFILDGEQLGMTDAQKAMRDFGNNMVDIRTSCDGKPIVCFNAAPILDGNGKPLLKNGVRQYEVPKYTGLYNIMTDKSSTALFGFENIYDENGEKIYDASKVECWECLSNAIDFPMGLDISCDRDSIENKAMDLRKPLWNGYEARWPDVKGPNGEQCAHTHRLESLWRFINFCKPAVKYTIGEVDGYSGDAWTKVKNENELETLFNSNNRPKFASGAMESGNMKYEEIETEDYNELATYLNTNSLYYFNNAIDYNKAKKELSGETIKGHIYKGKVASFDANFGKFMEDIQFDAERVDNAANGLDYKENNSINGSPVMEDYYIDVYLTQEGSQYKYTNEYGEIVSYKGSVDKDEYEKDKNGQSYAGKTYMQYFSEKKYDWFNVYRLAAYYVYLMRFAAVDQVVKNSMLTTEDGQHYYYINYDNDTILGVRNDGNLVYHWNITRDSYDYEVNGFCFAGNKSVLWNLLECDSDFMSVVQRVDNAMFASKVLSANIALEMYNIKQENSWGERMYNVNEQHKYLSQWKGKGAAATYLQFIHGSSNQYRSWFIKNRFNLYDSLWETGDYMTTKIGFRMEIDQTDRKSPMMKITAARENKFFLQNSDGQLKNVAAWKKQLAQGETGEWIAIENVKGMSSPWSLFGSDKIKILDFRPSIAMPNFELQELMFKDNVNWQEEKGCLMTSLLIGTSDEYIESELNRYTNKTNEKAVLLTTSITSSKPYTSEQKLNLTDAELNELGVVETFEDDTYVYSTTLAEVKLPTVILEPGEYFDRVSPIANYDNEKFVSAIIPKTTCAVRAIGDLNSLYSLEEIDIRNCFNPGGLLNDSIVINNLNNLHIFRAIGSSITSFNPAKGCSFTEISLPKDRIQTITFDNVSFSPSADDVPQFKYVPDAALRNVTFKNIIMDNENPAFDIKEFIDTWIDAYVNVYGENASDGSNNLKNLSLVLEGINLDSEHFVTFDWLVKLKKLNLISLTGDIYVLGDESGAGLTQEQFEKLNEMFEKPFEATSSLRLTTIDSTFWTILGKKIELEEPEYWGSGQTAVQVDEYYEILHEEVLKFRATTFKSDPNADTSQNYRFQYLDSRNQWMDCRTISNSKCGISTTGGYKFLLNINQTGNSEFVSYIHTIIPELIGSDVTGQNTERLIRIYQSTSTGRPATDKYLYVKIKEIVEPSKIELYCDGKKIEASNNSDTPEFKITFDENLKPHTFLIRYENGDEVTVDSLKPRVSFTSENSTDETSNKFGNISSVKVDANHKIGSEFEFAPLIQPSTASTTIYITAQFNTGLEDTGLKSISATLVVENKTILPSKVKLVIPDKYKTGEYAGSIFATYQTIYIDKSDGTTQTVNNAIKLTINCVIPKEGLDFPINPVAMSDNTINAEEIVPNVPIRTFNPIEFAKNAIATHISDPTLIQDENGQWYVHIQPTLSNKWNQSYDTEYNLLMSGTFGFNGGDWDTEETLSNNNLSFEYAWRLDSSIIWPDDIDIFVDYGTEKQYSIKTNNLAISASDTASKQFRLTIVPVNRLDEVTVPIKFTQFEFVTCVNYEDEDIIHPDKQVIADYNENSANMPPSATYEDFVSISDYTENGIGLNNPKHYPEFTLTINKYKPTKDDEPENRIVYLKPQFTISCKSDSILNTSTIVEIREKTIPFIVEQTISSTNKIEDCVPYAIEGNDDFRWYFVDSSNYYYQFDSSILKQLIESGKLNSLVGIAKRIQYGWGEIGDTVVDGKTIKKLFNTELNGNAYNNACEVWRFMPTISRNEYKSNTSFKNSYYRALCIPLANWKISEDMLNTTSNTAVQSDDPNHLWSTTLKPLNDKYGSWAIPRLPMYEVGDHAGTYTTGKPDVFKNWLNYGMVQGENILGICAQWEKIALHTNVNNDNKVLDGSVGCVYPLRSTTVDSIEHGLTIGTGASLRRNSMFDMREATQYLCAGKIPTWLSNVSNNVVSIPKNMLIDNLSKEDAIWPKYGNGTRLISGIADIWNHFKIYDNAVINKNQSKPSNLNELRCYPASLYELECLFNGSKHNKGFKYIAMYNGSETIYSDNISDSTSEFNDKVSGQNPVPYGIYEIVDALEKTECLKFENNKYSGPLAELKSSTSINSDTHNIFIENLYQYFIDGKHKESLDFYNGSGSNESDFKIAFGSLYFINTQATDKDSLNTISWVTDSSNSEKFGAFGFYGSQKITTEEKIATTSTIGSQKRLIMIPLLMVD